MVSSSIYQVFQTKDRQSGIKFLFCSAKNRGDKSKKCNHIPGTILNEDEEVIRQPTYWLSSNFTFNTTYTYLKFKIEDCTIINLYNFEGKWYMGTKNSWDISKTIDYTHTSFSEFFNQSITEGKYEFNYDNLDPAKVYTIGFCNPNCHLMAKEYKVFAYNEELTCFDRPMLVTDENEKNYVTLCQETGELFIKQTKLREEISKQLYSNRNKLRRANQDHAMIRVLINVLFCNKYKFKPMDLFLKSNLNDLALPLYNRIINVIDQFEKHLTIKPEFNGIQIPKYMLPKYDTEDGLPEEILTNPKNKPFLFDLILATP